MKIGIALAAVLLCGCSGKPQANTDRMCNLIHRPPSGCPDGYLIAKNFFTEKDGSSEDACVYGKSEERPANQCFDEWRDGEQLHFYVLPHAAPPEQPKEKVNLQEWSSEKVSSRVRTGFPLSHSI